MIFVSGECEGHRVSVVIESNSANKCLEHCQAIPECFWFTFLAEFEACYFFSDCNTIDETCTTCVSGEKGCKAEEPATTQKPDTTTTEPETTEKPDPPGEGDF